MYFKIVLITLLILLSTGCSQKVSIESLESSKENEVEVEEIVEIEKESKDSNDFLKSQAKDVANSLGVKVSKKDDNFNSIVVSKESKRVRISIKDDMMFESGSTKPTQEAKLKLKKLCFVLKNYPNTVVQIVGHTDDRGSFSYNYRLSERRALSVSEILKESGVKNQIRNQGCSFVKPLVENRDKFSRGLNRRVEIYLYPSERYYQDGCK